MVYFKCKALRFGLKTSETEKCYTCVPMYLYTMKRKKTFLYLNRELAERAKRENINISKLTEEALKQSLDKL
jgi:hypothetical protein